MSWWNFYFIFFSFIYLFIRGGQMGVFPPMPNQEQEQGSGWGKIPHPVPCRPYPPSRWFMVGTHRFSYSRGNALLGQRQLILLKEKKVKGVGTSEEQIVASTSLYKDFLP